MLLPENGSKAPLPTTTVPCVCVVLGAGQSLHTVLASSCIGPKRLEESMGSRLVPSYPRSSFYHFKWVAMARASPPSRGDRPRQLEPHKLMRHRLHRIWAHLGWSMCRGSNQWDAFQGALYEVAWRGSQRKATCGGSLPPKRCREWAFEGTRFGVQGKPEGQPYEFPATLKKCPKGSRS